MKTILTELGEMPLNDWLEMKLREAELCANMAKPQRTWIVIWKLEIVLSVVIYAFCAVRWMLHGHYIVCALSVLQGIASVFMGWSFIQFNNATIREFLLKRQEIVDEVAAVMRAFK